MGGRGAADVNDTFSLKGRRALIAGASRGIGLAIAQHMASAGAEVILAARSLDKLETEAEAIRGKGGHALALRMDMSDPGSIRCGVEGAGDVDILVNVTGTNIRKRFEEYTKEEYEHLLQTNLHGIVELTQQIGAKMIARGQGGKIITIGSLMSLRGLPYLSIYAITKGALAQLTKVLAAEWGRYGIHVNCIAPGFILTDLNRELWQQPKMHEWLKATHAIPRMGSVDDIAPLAVFLAGRGADYITGQVIPVDGGYTTTAVWPYEPSS